MNQRDLKNFLSIGEFFDNTAEDELKLRYLDDKAEDIKNK